MSLEKNKIDNFEMKSWQSTTQHKIHDKIWLLTFSKLGDEFFRFVFCSIIFFLFSYLIWDSIHELFKNFSLNCQQEKPINYSNEITKLETISFMESQRFRFLFYQRFSEFFIPPHRFFSIFLYICRSWFAWQMKIHKLILI